MGCKTLGIGQVEGFIEFSKSGQDRRIKLLNAPAGRNERAGKTEKINCTREVSASFSMPAASQPVAQGQVRAAKKVLQQDVKLRKLIQQAKN